MYRAREVTAAQFPTGMRILAALSRRAGLPAVPRLHIIPSRLMNAFAVGRRDRSAIAVTDALARTLTPRELAGVLAHEVSHIAHEDVNVMALADMVSRFTSLMSTIGLISLFLNLGGYAAGGAESVPWLAVVVLIASPTVGGLIQMALSRTREFDADLGAALLTGDPDGLASALTRLERAQGRVWENILLPGGRIPDPSVLRTHPLTAERIARLKALSFDPAVSGRSPPRAPSDRPAAARPSFVPKVRASTRGPHFGGFAAPLFLAGGPLPGPEEQAPASDRPLNPPAGRPRLHLRGAVWW
jgi:heat shock protein HtpX